MLRLRALVDALYRDGIDRSRLAHWAAAHDLVAAYVAPAQRLGLDRRRGASSADDEDPRGYIDLVRDDEFPLSIFYASLRDKLA